MKIGPAMLFERETILEGGEPYLVRYRLLDTPWCGIYLHHILKSDQQRDLHDHPWWFVSVMLWGRYREYYRRPSGIIGIADRRAPSIAFRRAQHFHRLSLFKPCWTLIIRGRRRREWGFQTMRGWVHFRDYLRGETDDGNRRTVV